MFPALVITSSKQSFLLTPNLFGFSNNEGDELLSATILNNTQKYVDIVAR